MALITMPTSPAFQSSNFGIRRAVGVSESPFTGSQQVQVYPKAQWFATLTLPTMSKTQAREWVNFFVLCEGRRNTFLLSDPDYKSINGTATTAAVAANKDTGTTVVNLTIGTGKTLNKGSYIQFGTGASSRLHMVVDDNTSNGNVSIQPPLKDPITTTTTVTIASPVGLFRMDNNELAWDADHLSRFGVSFSCSEAL
jgi:hypothetical protein